MQYLKCKLQNFTSNPKFVMDLHHGKGGSGGGWGATLGAGSRGVMKAAGGKEVKYNVYGMTTRRY